MPPGRVRSELVDWSTDGGDSPWTHSSISTVQEAAVLLAGALQGMFVQFVDAVLASGQAGQAAAAAVGPETAAIQKDHVSAALEASDFGAVFLNATDKYIILKINIIKPDTAAPGGGATAAAAAAATATATAAAAAAAPSSSTGGGTAGGNVLKTVKVDLAKPIQNVIDYLRGKWVNAKSDDRFILFLPTDDQDEVQGYFLDPQRTWRYYPTIREVRIIFFIFFILFIFKLVENNKNTVVEFHKVNRTLAVSVDERRILPVDIEETWTVEEIVREITAKVGIKDPARYGLLLVGNQRVGQRRDELDGQHHSKGHEKSASTDILGKMGFSAPSVQPPSQQPQTLSRSSLAMSSALSLSTGDLPALNAGLLQTPMTPLPPVPPTLARVRSTKNRPVSTLFFMGDEGLARASLPGSNRRDLPTMRNYATSDTRPSNAIVGITHSEIEYVQTKDKNEWLNPQVTLRGIGFDPRDGLLLVRLEKILGFAQRLNENPTKVCDALIENAEELLRGLRRVEQEMNALLGDLEGEQENKFVPESWTSPIDYKATRPGELSLSKGMTQSAPSDF